MRPLIATTIVTLALATGCYQNATPIETSLQSHTQAPQITLVPALATELAGATYCTPTNQPEIDNTQLCLHITDDGTYSLTTEYLLERGDCGSPETDDSDGAGQIIFYPSDNTDLVLSIDGTPYTTSVYYIGDNLILRAHGKEYTFNLIGYQND
jgi:hypothetical protein